MLNRKKILVLAMYCNQPLFLKQEQFLRDISYAKDIMDGKHGNVDFYSYTASKDDKFHYDKKLHRMCVPCDDTLDGTFDKTKKALMLLDALDVEYDYIFRTNCSTFVNVSLLEKFVNGIPEDKSNVIYGSTVYSSDGCGPELYDFYVPGNSMLISKFWCDVIRDADIEYYKQFDRTPNKDKKSYYCVDDNTIGFICNIYAEQHNICKYDIWGNYNGIPHIKVDMISADFVDHIVVPVRIYEGDREHEFYIHRAVKELFTESEYMKLNDLEVFNELTKKNRYLLFDFGKPTLLIESYEVIRSFVDYREKYNYNCENFISEILRRTGRIVV